MPLSKLDNDDFVTVHAVQGHMLAEMLKQKLEAAGIPTALRYESLGRVLSLTVDGLGKVELMVPKAFAVQAAELLTEDADISPESDSAGSAAG